MKNRDSIVIAIGLIVMIAIAALIIYGNNEYTAQSVKATNAVNGLLLQKQDFEIKKLVRQLNAKQKELNDTKAMLAGAKEKINNVRTDIGSTTGKPAAQ